MYRILKFVYFQGILVRIYYACLDENEFYVFSKRYHFFLKENRKISRKIKLDIGERLVAVIVASLRLDSPSMVLKI